MGLCASKEVEPATLASKEIDAKLKNEDQASMSTIRLLLLGAGQSGKSTIFKQVKIIHQSGFTVEERRSIVGVIHQNIAHNMLTLIDACAPDRLDIRLPDHLQAYADNLRDVYQRSQSVTLTPELTAQVKALWASDEIQQAFSLRSKILLLADSAEFFFNRIDVLVMDGYIPSDDDVLQARVRTTTIAHSEFKIDGAHFQLCDVGGQRSERRKWIHCFDNVQGVLFVAAINEYDQILEEDGRTNRLIESLNVFEDVCNSRFFEETAMILFLNKKDLFEKKIQHTNITAAFPEYDGPQKYGPALAHIRSQFESMNASESKKVYTHVTCATDTNSIRVVMTFVKDIMLNLNLQNSGFV